MKIDVEGFEPEVLAGVLDALPPQAAPPTILFEFEPRLWNRAVDADVTMERLAAAYELYVLSTAGAIQRADRPDSVASPLRNIVAIPIGRHGDSARKRLGL